MTKFQALSTLMLFACVNILYGVDDIHKLRAPRPGILNEALKSSVDDQKKQKASEARFKVQVINNKKTFDKSTISNVVKVELNDEQKSNLRKDKIVSTDPLKLLEDKEVKSKSSPPPLKRDRTPNPLVPDGKKPSDRMSFNLLPVMGVAVSLKDYGLKKVSKDLNIIDKDSSPKFSNYKDLGNDIVSVSMTIESVNAQGLRLKLTDVSLGSAELYVYSNKNVVGPFSGRGPNKENSFWTPTVFGSAATLEIVGKSSDVAQASFHLDSAGHMEGSFFDPPSVQEASKICKKIVEQKDANGSIVKATVNETCLLEFAAAKERKYRDFPGYFRFDMLHDTADFGGTTYDLHYENAIGAMLFPIDDLFFLCSGTLMNDSDDQTFIPYFLTANHCIGSQASADDLEVFFHYYKNSSSDPVPDQSDEVRVPHTYGADLLVNNDQTDFSFVVLRELPPADSFLMGVSLDPFTDREVIHRLSHPQGRILHYSEAEIYSDSYGCFSAEQAPGYTGVVHKFYYTYPLFEAEPKSEANGGGNYDYEQIGGVMGGSSGSSSFRKGGYVVGQLWGVCGFDTDNPCQQNYYNVEGDMNFSYWQLKNPTTQHTMEDYLTSAVKPEHWPGQPHNAVQRGWDAYE